jgi:hypothetical protein
MTCVLFVGCSEYTVEVKHKKKPVKYHVSHRTRLKPHSSQTPTPTITPTRKQPLQLEPTSSPTPMIQIPPTAIINQWTMTNV